MDRRGAWMEECERVCVCVLGVKKMDSRLANEKTKKQKYTSIPDPEEDGFHTGVSSPDRLQRLT